MVLLSQTGKFCHMTSVHKFDEPRMLKESLFLQQKGFEMHIIAHEAPKKSEYPITLHSVDVVEASYFKWIEESCARFVEKALEVDADVYHLHNAELLPAALWLKRHGKKVVVEVGEDFADAIMPEGLGFLERKRRGAWLRKFEKEVYKRVDLFVCATPQLMREFHHRGCLAVMIGDYPTEEEVRDCVVESIKNKDASMIFMGDLSSKKGLGDMLNLAAGLSKKLILAGEFVSAAELKEAQNHPGWGQVEWVPRPTSEELTALLKRSRVGLSLPYLVDENSDEPEQLGYYLSYGLLVVVTDCPQWKNLIEFNKAGVCVSLDDPETVKAGTRLLLEDDNVFVNFFNSAVELVREKYTWECMGKRLTESYGQVRRRGSADNPKAEG